MLLLHCFVRNSFRHLLAKIDLLDVSLMKLCKTNNGAIFMPHIVVCGGCSLLWTSSTVLCWLKYWSRLVTDLYTTSRRSSH